MPNPYVRESVHCAGPNCDAVRKEANHWFVIDAGREFECWLYDPEVGLDDDVLPVCGQQCAQKLFEQWLTKV